MDFTAFITLIKTEDGGRQSFTVSGYRPTLHFEGIDYNGSGQQIYPEVDRVFPGDDAIADITLISTTPYENKLKEGQEFSFFEGNRYVGYGKILKIVNKNLIKSV